MSLIPGFWTRVLMVVDFNLTTQPAAVLSWSHNLPLEVIVTRINFGHRVDVQHEWDQVVLIMKALVHSHVARFWRIHFNVMFSSSLPLFPLSFRGAWSNLSELLLQCQEDNGGSGSTDILESIISAEQPLGFPALRSLLIDGRNYYKASRKNSKWTVKCPSIRDMAISHYTPLPGESFTLNDVILPIAALHSFKTLSIHDVSLCPSSFTLTATLPLRGIHLSRIHDFTAIAEMLDLLPFNLDMAITRCAIGSPRGPFNVRGRLSLRDIDDDLVPLLRCWEGAGLTVENCPGFNDVVLDKMATVDAGQYFCAPNMGSLFISNCPNFSTAGLKRFVSGRMGVVKGRLCRGISEVGISGIAPRISIKDQRYISRHLNAFEYHPSSS